MAKRKRTFLTSGTATICTDMYNGEKYML